MTSSMEKAKGQMENYRKQRAKKAEAMRGKDAPTMSLRSELGIIEWDMKHSMSIPQHRLDRRDELKRLIKEEDEKRLKELVEETN